MEANLIISITNLRIIKALNMLFFTSQVKIWWIFAKNQGTRKKV